MRHIARRLFGSPAFTAVTLVTLAIGIGANTAIFSVINTVLWKPLPYRDPERLVSVWLTAPGINWNHLRNAAASEYFTFLDEGRVFEKLGMWDRQVAGVTGLGNPEQVTVLAVTSEILPILGVQPILGRWFTERDDSPGSPETAMLSYDYWQQRFGGSTSAIGRTLVTGGTPREIVGVMPRGFRFLDWKAALYLPLRFDRGKVMLGDFSYGMLARLKPGIALAQANADVARMLPLMLRKFPAPPGFSAKMFDQARLGPDVTPFKAELVGDLGRTLWVLMGTLGMVLLIACANVANLMLVRTEGRQRELAIRAALGAGWGKIARGLLAESVTLGIIGGAAGIGFAYAALRLLIGLGPAYVPRLDQISIDARVLLFTLTISILAGLFFGLIPCLKYARAPLTTGLREGGRALSQGRERHRTRDGLVIVQVALALVLLISSGLMIRTYAAMNHADPGFTRPEQILTMGIGIPEALMKDAGQTARAEREILRRLAAIPGVSSVGFTNAMSMNGNGSNDILFAEDRPYPAGVLPSIRRFKFVSPGFFQMVGRRILAGRELTWTDIDQQRPFVLISENLAREYWREPAAALGKRVRENPKADWREIVGVVADERDDGLDKKAPAIIYLPYFTKHFWLEEPFVQRFLTFAVRSPRTGTAGFLQEVQKAVWSVNPNLPLVNPRSLEELAQASMARTSFTLVMLALAAAMALLLGLVGIYGVISYSVSQRRREIGIRLALGAQQRAITGSFLLHALLLTGIGSISGLAAASALMRLLSSLLFEVSPVDPLTYATVAATLLMAALTASYVPARRAMSVDPAEALRAE
ncbi:MAG: ABC transporter permease [Acidobacteriia bacterium]|nr:ABC transporter permease [Terriglobia bacterium]